MNYYYRDLVQVIEEQNRIKRSIFRLLEESTDEDVPKPELKPKVQPSLRKIEINGIPETQPENLQYILTKLSRHMFSEVNADQVISIHRLESGKKPRPIIVKMKNPMTCQELLTAYTEYNERNRNTNLNSEDLGFKGLKLPVLLSQHPSSINKTHRRAVRLAQGKKLKKKSGRTKKTNKNTGDNIATTSTTMDSKSSTKITGDNIATPSTGMDSNMSTKFDEDDNSTKITNCYDIPTHSRNYVKPSYSSDYDMPSHSSDYDMPSHFRNYDIPSHSRDYDMPSHSRNYDMPSHSRNYDMPSHSRNYDMPSHSRNYDMPSHSRNYDMPSHSRNYNISNKCAGSNFYVRTNNYYSHMRSTSTSEDSFNAYNYYYNIRSKTTNGIFGQYHNSDDSETDDDAVYSKSFIRHMRRAKERNRQLREERKIARKNRQNESCDDDDVINKKGRKSLHKKSVPRPTIVNSLQSLALSKLNKNIVG